MEMKMNIINRNKPRLILNYVSFPMDVYVLIIFIKTSNFKESLVMVVATLTLFFDFNEDTSIASLLSGRQCQNMTN